MSFEFVMSLSFVIVRIILGLIFTVGGFLLSNSLFFRDNRLLSLPYFGETLAGFFAGAVGIFLVPIAVSSLQKWFINLIQITVQTTVARSMGSFFAAQAARRNRLPMPKDRTLSMSPDSRSQITQTKTPGVFSNPIGPTLGHPPAAENQYFALTPPVILDTSAIIDGRIFDIARAGFLSAVFILPSFVIEELQKIADSKDDLKRQRGRRGLDLLNAVRREKKLKLTISKDKVTGETVDERLLSLTQSLRGKLATVDFNLNKAASVLGSEVLNVNDLTNAVKTTILPGEMMTLKIVQKGKEPGQGLAYLPDGTMIVVEDGGEVIGQEVTVKVVRLLQSSAGKMIFARQNPS